MVLALNGVLWAAKEAGIKEGDEVTLTYKLSVNGALLETADAKNPLIYKHGAHQIVPGLEKALIGLRVGDQKTVRVSPEEAYGPKDPKAFQEIEKDQLPSDVPSEVGTLLEARSPAGEQRLVKIVEVKEKSVVIDFNHPLAGKELEFQVEVLQIK